MVQPDDEEMVVGKEVFVDEEEEVEVELLLVDENVGDEVLEEELEVEEPLLLLLLLLLLLELVELVKLRSIVSGRLSLQANKECVLL